MIKVYTVSETVFYETSCIRGVFLYEEDAIAFIHLMIEDTDRNKVPVPKRAGSMLIWNFDTYSYDLEVWDVQGKVKP